MTRQLRRRPRQLCRLPGVVPACLAFGSEAACALCDMIDFDHPVTCAGTGRYPATDRLEAAEAPFWAHLARRSDGGPATAAQLEAANARRRDKTRSDQDRKVRAAVVRHSPLPVDPPF